MPGITVCVYSGRNGNRCCRYPVSPRGPGEDPLRYALVEDVSYLSGVPNVIQSFPWREDW